MQLKRANVYIFPKPNCTLRFYPSSSILPKKKLINWPFTHIFRFTRPPIQKKLSLRLTSFSPEPCKSRNGCALGWRRDPTFLTWPRQDKVWGPLRQTKYSSLRTIYFWRINEWCLESFYPTTEASNVTTQPPIVTNKESSAVSIWKLYDLSGLLKVPSGVWRKKAARPCCEGLESPFLRSSPSSVPSEPFRSIQVFFFFLVLLDVFFLFTCQYAHFCRLNVQFFNLSSELIFAWVRTNFCFTIFPLIVQLKKKNNEFCKFKFVFCASNFWKILRFSFLGLGPCVCREKSFLSILGFGIEIMVTFESDLELSKINF